MRRRLLIAVLVWAALVAIYANVSGATLETQRGNIVGTFVFVVVLNVLAWQRFISPAKRVLVISLSVILLAVGSTWKFTENEFVRDATTYMIFFGMHVTMLAAIVGALLGLVWLVDWIVQRVGGDRLAACVLVALMVIGCATAGRPTDIGPVVILRPDVIYPDELRRRGVEGLVKVEAMIGRDGVPRNVRVLHDDPAVPATDPALEKLTVDTVSTWRFRPATANSVPAERRFVTFIHWKAN